VSLVYLFRFAPGVLPLLLQQLLIFLLLWRAPPPHPDSFFLGGGSTKKRKSPVASALALRHVCVGLGEVGVGEVAEC
jgi:hypothetical protein